MADYEDYKEEIGDVLYDYGRGLYANITNRCPCRCEFCIRDMTDSLGSADSLWLKREPTVEEVIAMLKEWDLNAYEELVFCGYGEPTSALDNMLETAKYVREKHPDITLRLNTNGLSDRINKKPTAELISKYIDSVSISLNTCSSEKYDEVCRPVFDHAYESMLKFAEDAKKYFKHTQFSIVDTIPEEDIKACQKIADDRGIHLKIRKYSD